MSAHNTTSSKANQQMPWEKCNLDGTNLHVWPSFCHFVDHAANAELLTRPKRSYTDDTLIWRDLHKNVITMKLQNEEKRYKPRLTKTEFAFPSLLYPPALRRGYAGFIEVSNEAQVNKSCLGVEKFPYIGNKGLGQVGETICVDPVVTYCDGEKRYVLMGIKKIGNAKLRMLVGGGMMDPDLSVRENIAKELREEALGGEKLSPEFEKAIEQGRYIYAGYLISPRNTNDRWHTTVAMHIEISKETAKNLNLVSDPKEDIVKPHWFDCSQIFSDAKISPSHQRFIYRAMNDKVRYCQIPNPMWTPEQLDALRSVMNNLPGDNKSFDPDWCFKKSLQKNLVVNSWTSISATDVWLETNKLANSPTNIVIGDTKNETLDDQKFIWSSAWYCHYIYEDGDAFHIYIYSDDTPHQIILNHVGNKRSNSLFFYIGKNDDHVRAWGHTRDAFVLDIIKYFPTIKELANWILQNF